MLINSYDNMIRSFSGRYRWSGHRCAANRDPSRRGCGYWDSVMGAPALEQWLVWSGGKTEEDEWKK